MGSVIPMTATAVPFCYRLCMEIKAEAAIAAPDTKAACIQ